MSNHRDAPTARGTAVVAPHQGDDGCWLSFNVHGNIVFCSQPLAKAYGCNAAALQGVGVAALLPSLPLHDNTSRQKVAAMMGYVDRRHRLQLSLADGRTVPVDAAISSVMVETGPVFVIHMKRAERARENFAAPA